MDKELAERLEKLESHQAHLEHLVDQLNEVVRDQGRQLTKIQSQQQREYAAIDPVGAARFERPGSAVACDADVDRIPAMVVLVLLD